MKQHTAVRFPPVSGYDIPGLERWLQRMAARGMQFSMTLGPFTLFLPAEPTSLRIHLEPARRSSACTNLPGGHIWETSAKTSMCSPPRSRTHRPTQIPRC